MASMPSFSSGGYSESENSEDYGSMSELDKKESCEDIVFSCQQTQDMESCRLADGRIPCPVDKNLDFF